MNNGKKPVDIEKNRKKILVICTKPIDRLDEGGKIRTYHIVKYLAAMFVVDVLSLSDDRKTEVMSIPGIRGSEIVLLRKGFGRKLLDVANSLINNIPYTVMKYYSPVISRTIRRRVGQGGYSLVFFSNLHSSVYSDEIVKEHGTGKFACAIDEHNVETNILSRTAVSSGNYFKKAAYGMTARMMRSFESTQVRKANFVQCVSESDRRQLEEMSGRKVIVVENGVDMETHKPGIWREECKNLLFVGSLDWLPNRDAVEYFLGSVFPAIRNRVVQARFIIAGKNVRNQIRVPDAPDVVTRFNVEDIRAVYRESNIFVVPLRIGGGTRLKILEAMAQGKVVVSTTIGAEGLDLEAGRDILIADDPASFADAVVSCIKRPEWAKEIAKNGLLAVQGRYAWDSICKKMAFLEA